MKRFYSSAQARQVEGGWQVFLDTRPMKTVGGNPQIVPSRALAERLAAEWDEQPEEIDPARFVLRDHTDYAIDKVAPDPATTIEQLLAFAQTDTLCYRAPPGDWVLERQERVWEPLLAVLEAQHAVTFQRVGGVMHQPQPDATVVALREALAQYDAFALAGLQAMASLAASLCIALLAHDADADGVPDLWQAASLEEDLQAERWGRDEEAEAVRQQRRRDFLIASEFVRLSQAGD